MKGAETFPLQAIGFGRICLFVFIGYQLSDFLLNQQGSGTVAGLHYHAEISSLLTWVSKDKRWDLLLACFKFF